MTTTNNVDDDEDDDVDDDNAKANICDIVHLYILVCVPTHKQNVVRFFIVNF